ncbi:site-specific integrase (plasmid) [Edwardsiella piscicida]|uniref:tyrosine-type recombinase/integrase n=1 Tax=Edwardsiella TaxID=635 RepID=UPI001F3777CA|nr:site-specific integrase [Edwardsiella piscicida]UJT80918.1 site-specific integrase [Edwardsiella piscicida]
MSAKTRIKKITLQKALERYCSTVSVHKKGYQQEFYRVQVISRHPISQKNMDEITTVDIASYRDNRLSDINPKTKNKISGNTVRLELALLSSLYNIARIEWGTCKSNPVELVRKPKLPSGRTRRLSPLEEQSISNLLIKKNNDLFVIFKLALSTAMRQGEILSLRWENINTRMRVAHLPYTKNGSSRNVPLSHESVKLLSAMIAKKTGPVFSYTSSGLKSAWRLAIQELDIKDLHFHDLRHEAISRLFELGTLNVIEISSISGHRSINMLKRYTHLQSHKLASKLDKGKKQQKNNKNIFIPYPAILEKDIRYKVSFFDFDNLYVEDESEEHALRKASETLLRILATSIHNGEPIPPPGLYPQQQGINIMICPLNPELAISKLTHQI